jgi:hypothetical protein
MSVSFSTVFESAVPPYGTLGGDHLAILPARRRLDRLAADNGLTPLGAFESYAPEDTTGLLDDETQERQPPAEWFAPADALVTVNALWEHLDAHPGLLANQTRVMDDLSEIGDELEAAERAGGRFRFAVVP